MSTSSNIFSNKPVIPDDGYVEKVKHHYNPEEYYYCGQHFITMIDANRHVNFSVGSIQRYLMAKTCDVCVDKARVVVVVR